MNRIYHEDARRELARTLTLPRLSHPRAYDLSAIFERTYANVGDGDWRRIVSDDTYWLTVLAFAHSPMTAAWIIYEPNQHHRWALQYATSETIQACQAPITGSLYDECGGKCRPLPFDTPISGRLRPRGHEDPGALIDKLVGALGWIRGHELTDPSAGEHCYAVYYRSHTQAAADAELQIKPHAGPLAWDSRAQTIDTLREAAAKRQAEKE